MEDCYKDWTDKTRDFLLGFLATTGISLISKPLWLFIMPVCVLVSFCFFKSNKWVFYGSNAYVVLFLVVGFIIIALGAF